MNIVPFLDLASARDEVGVALTQAFHRVMSRQWVVLGPELEAFEAELATLCDVRHAIGVGNGLDVPRLALLAADVGHLKN